MRQQFIFARDRRSEPSTAALRAGIQDLEPATVVTIAAWEGYWRHTQAAAAHRAGGPQEAVLEHYWTTLFERVTANRQALRVLDVACGNGVVCGYLQSVLDRLGPGAPVVTALGLDGSTAALEDLRRHRPRVLPVAADVRRIPFRDACFDLVFSQFGFEYGGADAVLEAARTVAPGGTLAALLHLRDGGIYRECALNLRAIEAMHGLLPRARETLAAGIAASRGEGPRTAFVEADRRFVPALAAVEAVFRAHGTGVAGGVVHRLYTDIGHIYRSLGRYAGAEVDAWLDAMSAEMETYRQRMTAMLSVALDAVQMQAITTRLEAAGMGVLDCGTLAMAGADSGWTLVARRPP
jgi:SAM-dependent methyltransferase